MFGHRLTDFLSYYVVEGAHRLIAKLTGKIYHDSKLMVRNYKVMVFEIDWLKHGII